MQDNKNLYKLIQEQMQLIDQLNRIINNLACQTIEQDSLIEGLLENRNTVKGVH